MPRLTYAKAFLSEERSAAGGLRRDCLISARSDLLMANGISTGTRRAVIAAKKSCVIIYNPHAGKLKRRGSDRLERSRRILTEAGYEATLVPTSGPGAAVALARGWVADGVGLIVAAGGDGTVNEVAEGMVHSAVPLGILPAGTANVLATETGMSSNLETAARDPASRSK